MDELTDAWRTSPEHRRQVRGGWFTVLVVIALGVTSYVLYRDYRVSVGLERFLGPDLALLALAVVTALVVAVLALLVNLAYRDALQREYLDCQRVADARRLLDRAEQTADRQGPLDLNALWSLTQRRLDYYHALATSQAERSFRQAQRAVVVGFAVLVIAVVAVAFTGVLAVAVVAGSVGVVGALVAVYLGRSFLRAHEGSVNRLHDQFSEPSAFSRQLSAERLLILLEAEDRAAAVRDLIRAVVAMPPASAESVRRGRHSSVPE
jgi:hypothetical protein